MYFNSFKFKGLYNPKEEYKSEVTNRDKVSKILTNDLKV